MGQFKKNDIPWKGYPGKNCWIFRGFDMLHMWERKHKKIQKEEGCRVKQVGGTYTHTHSHTQTVQLKLHDFRKTGVCSRDDYGGRDASWSLQDSKRSFVIIFGWVLLFFFVTAHKTPQYHEFFSDLPAMNSWARCGMMEDPNYELISFAINNKKKKGRESGP